MDPLLRLGLKVVPEVGPCGGRQTVRLLLGNSGEEDLSTRLPENWESCVRARLVRPDGVEEIWAPFRSHGADAADAPRLVLYDGADRAAEFSLKGLWLQQPGRYQLSATIHDGQSVMEFPEANFRIDEVASLELAIPNDTTWDQHAVNQAWLLLKGDRHCYLRRATIVVSEQRGVPELAAYEDVAVLPAGTWGVTSLGSGSGPSLAAWLGHSSFYAGVTRYGFVSGTVKLPGEARRILGRGPVGVLSAGGRELWILDINRDGPEVELVLQLRLPGNAVGAALSEEEIVVVCHGDEGSGLDVFFAGSMEQAEQGAWRKTHLRGARALEGADPQLRREEDGATRVSLLVVSPSPTAPHGRVGVVHIGFDRHAEPAYWPGLGWEKPWPLEDEPEKGTLLVSLDSESDTVRYDWCVALPGRRVFSRFGTNPPVLSTLFEDVLQPMRLFGLTDRLAIATAERGQLGFEAIQTL